LRRFPALENSSPLAPVNGHSLHDTEGLPGARGYPNASIKVAVTFKYLNGDILNMSITRNRLEILKTKITLKRTSHFRDSNISLKLKTDNEQDQFTYVSMKTIVANKTGTGGNKTGTGGNKTGEGTERFVIYKPVRFGSMTHLLESRDAGFPGVATKINTTLPEGYYVCKISLFAIYAEKPEIYGSKIVTVS
jgi:hypothetical protein